LRTSPFGSIKVSAARVKLKGTFRSIY